MSIVGSGVEQTSATSGSADSQAADLDERTWKPRRRLAWTIRALVFAIPVAASYSSARIFAEAVPRPAGIAALLFWLVMLLGLAWATLRISEKLARRLLPISAMLKMSLVFPDRAPSQFSAALKSASGKQLAAAVEQRATEQRLGTPQETAENLVLLLAALRAHDPITRGHCERVRAYSAVIANQMELPAEDAAKLQWAALIHDLGKLDVPAELLNKKDRLTEEEWAIVKGHPAAASKWTEGVGDWLGDWVLAATEHHERWDGTGYPLQLRAEQISLAGRIVAVADAFDVMTAARSYKKPLPREQARAELAKGSGTQFDPRVVRAMLDASIPTFRRGAGPLAMIANLPTVFHAPLAVTAGVASTAATAVGTAAVISVAAIAPTAHPLIDTNVADEQTEGADSAATTTEVASATADRDGPELQRAPTSLGPPSTTATTSNGPDKSKTTTTTTTARAKPNTLSQSPSATSTPTSFPLPTMPPPTTTIAPTTTVHQSTTTTSPQVAIQSGHGPVSREDRYRIPLGTQTVQLDVLSNDVDVDGDLQPSSLRLIVGSVTGNYAYVANGKIVFSLAALPDPAFRFDDALMYSVCDKTDLCATANVRISFEQPTLFG